MSADLLDDVDNAIASPDSSVNAMNILNVKLISKKKMVSYGAKAHKDDVTEYLVGMQTSTTRQNVKKQTAQDKEAKQKEAMMKMEDKQTKIMASMVPDEIIYNVNDYSLKYMTICVLFGDVSGFTDLSDRYNKHGQGGPGRLTQILNGYIGSMVQEILSHGGDIYKFSGDAFLAFWKVSKHRSIRDAVHDALDSAIMIQKHYGKYPTDVGVVLRVKLAVAAGDVVHALIGTEINSHYVVAGPPILDVKEAERISSPGEVIVAPTAIRYINTAEYNTIPMEDERHTKVLDFGTFWRATMQKSQNDEEVMREKYNNIRIHDTTGVKADSDAASVLMGLNGEVLDMNVHDITDKFSMRPAVNSAARYKLKTSLHRFMLAPVMYAIESNQPMEYLTEMRQAVIMFINIVPISPISASNLVHMTQAAYITACDIVRENFGIVNKVSLFDKDLMLIIIFGLRGFKREFESETALRCGATLRETLISLKNATSVTVSVTTGMTYCGVVGHTLRREYTVIGVVVNKAARLMIAYPNRVVCDKETFIQSKMEAKHFTLQPHKEMKGLHAVGPVYEFKEILKTEQMQNVSITKYPLLGREALIAYFLDCLNRFAKEYEFELKTGKVVGELKVTGAIMFRGEARQGKTRFMDELLYLTPEKYNVTRVGLSSQDVKIPYSAISLIIRRILGISNQTPVKEKEKIISEKLRHLQIKELFCSLNLVFNVNFVVSEVYYNLSDKKKVQVRKQLFQHLCIASCSGIWVVIVDDLEYADDESWGLMPVLLETSLAFFVFSCGNRRVLSEVATTVIAHSNVVNMSLKGVDKEYQAALACQMLEVWAIPLDLEKTIQDSSKGNPGWIESFLLALIQAGGLQIRAVKPSEIIKEGLVIPPIEQMVRVTEQNFNLINSKIDANGHGWRMYDCSYNESQINVLNNKAQEIYQTSKTVTVAMLATDNSMEACESDLTMDVIILMIFDSLSVFEQLVCKASAVLGDTFKRNMLKYVMDEDNAVDIARAIAKLFEIHVFCCEFDVYHTAYINVEQLRTDSEIRCYCSIPSPTNSTDTLLASLPKYAMCESLRFKMGMFRQTVYTLMTELQRNELHTRAYRFLERETRRCTFCGGGFFERILGGRDEGLRLHTKSGKYKKVSLTNHRKAMTAAYKKRTGGIHMEDSDKKPEEEKVDQEMNKGDPRFFRGLTTARTAESVHSDTSLSRPFTSIDFTNCECTVILMSMYSQILEHCKGLGNMHVIIDAYLEYATVCISSSNTGRAIVLLEEADNLISNHTYHDIPEWRIMSLKGKIKTLLGYTYILLGQIETAYKLVHEAFVLFGHKFPKSERFATILTKCKRMKLSWMLKHQRTRVGQRKGREAQFYENVAECLEVMCDIYKIKGQWRFAEYASIWSLVAALESDKDFCLLCNAYTNMLDVSYHYGHHELSWYLENSALAMVMYKKDDDLLIQDLSSVARLYNAVFTSRVVRCELIHAISLGYKTLHIAENIHEVSLRLHILPLLIPVLISRCMISDAVGLLQQLHYVAAEDSDDSGKLWYYALCMEIMLDTGYTVITYKDCLRYMHDNFETLICLRDPSAELTYYSNMWLWCVRNYEWEGAAYWEPMTKPLLNVTKSNSVAYSFCCCRLLEGMIIRLAIYTESKDIDKFTRVLFEIQRIKKSVKESIVITQSSESRFLIIDAFLRKVRYSDHKAINMLNKARRISAESQNLAGVIRCEHIFKSWTGALSSIAWDMWRNKCSGKLEDSHMWHESVNSPGHIIIYTYRIPSMRMV